jgi:ribonuclease J
MSLNTEDKSPKVRIIALGGLEEIGKNTTIIECGEDLFLVDGGLAFPTDEMIGVDLVLPDVSYLVENQHRIRGLAITHGHEDHIGGIPFMLKEVTIPVIYGPSLAIGLLEGKLDEAGLASRTTLKKVGPREKVQFGCFSVEFIRCTHSIADSYSLIIRSPIGTIVHTGDFKFDFTPVDDEQYDIASLAKASAEGIIALLSDSTNSEREGYTPSERTVWPKLNEVFGQAKGRLIVTTFASNVNRVRQVLQAAMNYNRKVAVLGRSMLTFAAKARELGYMSYPDGLLVPVEHINQLPKDEVVILTTGSQGEPMSALTRIANNEHRKIRIIPGDTVVISATPIPGNERSVANTINALFERGANVIYGRDAGIHVSGHACQEEQKLMLNLTKPKYFIPVHGEYRMLVKHGELAQQCGVKAENIFIMGNGDVLELGTQSGSMVGEVQSGITLIDFNRDWQIDEDIVQERLQLADDGMVAVAVTVGSEGELLSGPDVSLRGLIVPRGVPVEELVIKIRQQAKVCVEELVGKHSSEEEVATNLKEKLVLGLGDFFEREVRSNPLIHTLVMRATREPKVFSAPEDAKGKGGNKHGIRKIKGKGGPQ